MPAASILVSPHSRDYELLDTGAGEKLERYGKVTLRRPDPQALWPKRLASVRWDAADGTFETERSSGAGWSIRPGVPDRWQAEIGGLRFWIKPTPFKHTGVFPEQAPNWAWIQGLIRGMSGKASSVLNLFGYTGGATLAAAQAGAEVCHVDGSKAAITWAKENAALNGLADRPIRWIEDDARAFLRREVKRGRRYDGIVLDPPAFGRGAKGQVWKIEEDLPDLLDLCWQVLTDTPRLVLLNGYASGYSAIAYRNNLLGLVERHGGSVESGELALQEGGDGGRLLPCGIFARWRAE